MVLLDESSMIHRDYHNCLNMTAILSCRLSHKQGLLLLVLLLLFLLQHIQGLLSSKFPDKVYIIQTHQYPQHLINCHWTLSCWSILTLSFPFRSLIIKDIS